MKKSILISIAVLISFVSFSQKSISVKESNEAFADGSHNALSVIIFEAEKKNVEKGWIDIMKKYKAKVSNKEEIFAQDGQWKFEEKWFNSYARVESVNGGMRLIVAFDLGGAYLSSAGQPEKFEAAKTLLYDLAIKIAKDMIKEAIKEEEKALDKLQKDQSNLEKDNEGYHTDIDNAKDKITKAENNIKTNADDQIKKKQEITEQQKRLDDVKAKLGAVK